MGGEGAGQPEGWGGQQVEGRVTGAWGQTQITCDVNMSTVSVQRQIALRLARIVEYFSIGFIALLTRPRYVETSAGALNQANNGAIRA